MTGEYYVAIDEREKLNEGLIASGVFTVNKEMLVLEFASESGRDPRALVINNRNDFQWVDLVRLRHVRNIPLSQLLQQQAQVAKPAKPAKQTTPEETIAEVTPEA